MTTDFAYPHGSSQQRGNRPHYRQQLHHGYRFKHPLAIAAMRAVDVALAQLPWRLRPLPEKIANILIIKPDHLGDLMLLSAVLPLLSDRFPHAAIDLLCGPWGDAVLANNHRLRRRIYLVHPAYDRRAVALSRKFVDFLSSVWHVLRDLRRKKYDLCLNLRDAGGELILLARLGGCRHIIGHATGGFGSLLDTVVPWQEGRHEAEHYLEVLASLGINAPLEALRYELHPGKDDAAVVDRIIAENHLGQFVVFHPGSGDRRKLRPAQFWGQLIDTLPQQCHIVITGTQEETVLYDEISGHSARQICNLMGRLSVLQLFVLFTRAAAVYALDSLAAHLGAAAETPTTVFWSDTNDPAQWKPLGDQVVICLPDTPHGA